jgi:tetratricopeptide (TPR) repeat protein
MKHWQRLVLYIVLVTLAIVFGFKFQRHYARFMNEQFAGDKADLADTRLPTTNRVPSFQTDFPTLLKLGGVFVLSAIGAGLLFAHDVSVYIASKTHKALYNEEGEGIKNPEWEIAEEEWGRGNFLEAIRLMREYLVKNPREQWAALRIAEIYEKDLNNYLAAALEYEEVLKHKLSPERWGWAAIHLANLYSGKLEKPDQAVGWLRRIVTEYGHTAAAKKARERLGLVDMAEEGQPQAKTSDAGLPPGFSPRSR